MGKRDGSVLARLARSTPSGTRSAPTASSATACSEPAALPWQQQQPVDLPDRTEAHDPAEGPVASEAG